MHVYPLLIEPTPKAGLKRVQDFNLRPRDAKPLQSYSLAERNQHMSDAADEIAEIANTIAEQKGAAAAMSELLTLPFGVETSEPKDLIVSGVKIERIAPAAESARAAPIVDITGLPETGYERLVGRDAELTRLDQAWSDGKTNILSLIAEGGAGKSALVNEWLTRLQADGYRGAERVLGWSFYSQGSKERATAADAFLNWALAKLDRENRHDQRLRQGRGDRRGADDAARPACARRRRAVAARAGSASGPAQGPGLARVCCAASPPRRRERATA